MPLAAGETTSEACDVDRLDLGRGAQLDVVLLVVALVVDVGLSLASPRRYSLDSGGRSYGRSASAPIRTRRPSKPSSRRVSAALAPARLAPTITNALVGRHRVPPGSGLGAPRARGTPVGCGIVADEPVKGRRRGAASRASGRRAGTCTVLGLDHDADALRIEVLVDPAGDLASSAAPAPEGAGRTARRPGRASTGQGSGPGEIADMGDAVEGQEVVLAERAGTGCRGRPRARRSARRSGTSWG